ncbi:hypothetical protein I4641_00055 [Waterburya agarophytonicola K14]|uniref:Uncharacterized protein n=1 Tax=Waterburya agarophytonicola KI4 TaxID=2874699 RepID=A0A964BMG2_9CYAN|nr:hypothetical protein [Waterburya agarophytonicola KI4]
MEKVVIIINAEVSEKGNLISASPVTQKMVEALQRSIAEYSSPSTVVEIVSAATLWSKHSINIKKSQDDPAIYFPLTIQLPEYFDFPQKQIYSDCKDVNARRRWVEKTLGFKTSFGDSWLGHLWLPIVLTDKPIFAEVIGEGSMPNSYEQPIPIPSRQRKSIHGLAEQLLDSLDAPPATYLLQFSLHNGEIVFDRLWPFPAAPALITLKTQKPDLFTCHWHCLTKQPIPDINVSDAMPI